jgi:hypothetical protein
MLFRRFASVVGLAAALCPASVLADELPAMKAGLWESRMEATGGGLPPSTSKQCMDGKIDLEGMMKQMGGMCQVTWKRVGDAIETDSACKMGPVTARGKGIVTGDFNSKLHIETTTITEVNMPAGGPKSAVPIDPIKMVIDARWLGPCEAGQSPGDIIMPDGKVMRLPKMPAMPGG